MYSTYLDELIGILNERDKYIYHILRNDSDRTWYIFDIEEDPLLQVIWCHTKSTAYKFSTKNSAETFAKMYLHNRPSIQITKTVNIYGS